MSLHALLKYCTKFTFNYDGKISLNLLFYILASAYVDSFAKVSVAYALDLISCQLFCVV